MSENMFYQELRSRQQLCDAVIRADGTEFYVHKLVSCKCSPYFRAMFSHWSTPDCVTFDIPNVSTCLMSLIIEFAYVGNVHSTRENVQEVFIVADRFNIAELLQACSEFLQKKSSPLNCLNIWMSTDTFYDPESREKAKLYASSHFKEVVDTCADFLSLSAQQLVQIIDSDQLIVKKEEIVYEAILKWLAHAPQERRGYGSMLFSKSYICGGFNGIECLFTAECYNPNADQWTSIADMNSRRSGVGVAVYANHIFAVGGFNGVSRLNTAEAYNPSTNTWCNVANMPTARSNFGISVINDHLFAVGGFGGITTITDVEFYDNKTNLWFHASNMKLSRSALSSCVVNGLDIMASYAATLNHPQLHDLPSVEEDEMEQ